MDTLFSALGWAKWIAGWLGWFGVGAVPLVAAIALIVSVPSMRRPAIIAAAVWTLLFTSYTYGDRNGAARITAQWEAAELRAIERGDAARERAEKEIQREEAGAPAGVPVDRARVVPNDRYDRDNH